MREILDPAEPFGLGLEHIDEQLADHLALRFRIGDALERIEELRRSIDRDERDVVVTAEEIDDFLRLALAQQTMIDEDAGELIADRLVDEERGHGRIDPAREPAHDIGIAHLLADARDLALAEMRHGPIAGAAGDVAHEIPEQRRALRRVHHLGMELHAIELPRIVGDRRERRAGRDADGAKAWRQPRHAVAVAHPHLRPLAFLEHAIEERGLVDDLQLGAAELAVVPALDGSAERSHHGLLAIADAEHGDARVEHGLRRLRRAGLVHGCRPARKDDGARPLLGERGLGLVERNDLGIDARLAHAARDQLRHLAAEIDDQDAILRFVRHGKWL